jgi:hypothetical protein
MLARRMCALSRRRDDFLKRRDGSSLSRQGVCRPKQSKHQYSSNPVQLNPRYESMSARRWRRWAENLS